MQLLSVPPCLENGLLTYVLCNVTHRLLLSLTWPWDLCLGQGKKFPFFLFFHIGNIWQFFSKNFIFESIPISYPQIFSNYFIDDSDIAVTFTFLSIDTIQPIFWCWIIEKKTTIFGQELSEISIVPSYLVTSMCSSQYNCRWPCSRK